MKAALAIAVLAFGGTALAARTGSLPPAAQERAHDLLSGVGVPAPVQTTLPVPTSSPSRTASAVPSATPTPSRTSSPTPSAPAPAVDLCRVWDDARQPPGKAVPAETRRALAAAAGGVPEIDDYCAGVLGRPSATPTPTETEPPDDPEPPKASDPGRPSKSKKPKATPSRSDKIKNQPGSGTP